MLSSFLFSEPRAEIHGQLVQHYDEGKDIAPFKAHFSGPFAAQHEERHTNHKQMGFFPPFYGPGFPAIDKKRFLQPESKRLKRQPAETKRLKRKLEQVFGPEQETRQQHKPKYFPRKYLQNIHTPPVYSVQRKRRPRLQEISKRFQPNRAKVSAKKYRPRTQKRPVSRARSRYSPLRIPPQHFMPLVTKKLEAWRPFARTSQEPRSKPTVLQVKPDLRLKPASAPELSRSSKKVKYNYIFPHNKAPGSDYTKINFPRRTGPQRLWPKGRQNKLRLPQERWFNNEALTVHRQDSVNQGIYDDTSSDHDSEGVLNTNSIWSDVIKAFDNKLQTPETSQLHQTNVSSNVNASAIKDRPLWEITVKFPDPRGRKESSTKAEQNLEDPAPQSSVKSSKALFTPKEAQKQRLPNEEAEANIREDTEDPDENATENTTATNNSDVLLSGTSTNPTVHCCDHRWRVSPPWSQ